MEGFREGAHQRKIPELVHPFRRHVDVLRFDVQMREPSPVKVRKSRPNLIQKLPQLFLGLDEATTIGSQ
jgi:hypothetical protein